MNKQLHVAVRLSAQAEAMRLLPICKALVSLQAGPSLREAFIERYGARNSRMDLSMIQQVHDLTASLGAKCHREGPYR